MDDENKKQDDEISFIDLFAVIWHRKVMIIVITLLGAVGVVIYSVLSIMLPPEKSFMPNVYTPKALMLIDNRSSSGGGLSSMLGNMGGLASLAGINVSSSSNYSQLAIFLVGTNSMLDALVDEFDIINRYMIEEYPITSGRKVFKDRIKVDYDITSGVLSISFTDIDPVFARNVVNYCTFYLGKRFDELGVDKNKIEKENLEVNIANTLQEIELLEEESRKLEQSVASAQLTGRLPAIMADINRILLDLETRKQVYTQLKIQYELLKVSMASEKPVFQILEMAEVPEMKSGPSRGMLCIVVTFAAGFMAILLAFVLNAITNIKNDSDAMSKLRRKKRKKNTCFVLFFHSLHFLSLLR
jgi:uncharacterized protein involved in exopolysaccharide biosynthesis